MYFSALFWMLCPVSVLVQTGLGAQIQLDENGYKGIVVAIERTIPQVESDIICNAIRRLFNFTSQYLYQSMHQRAYFSEIKILLPPTWSSEVWMERTSSEMYETADIKIISSEFAKEAHVEKMSSECGKGAQTILIPDSFLSLANSANVYGGDHDPGRLMVKLWSQFRYGVYDEHGYPNDKSYPFFYFDEEMIIPMPTACSTADLFFGDVIDVRNGKPCTNMNEIMFGGYCKYILNPDYDETNSSINYAHYFSPITQFCDKHNNLHNDRAPTKQNTYCFYRSTWSVIMDHKDFANGTNKDRRIVDVTPRIKVLYPAVRHFVLAFDISNDGEIPDKMHWFKQALSKFIEFEMNLGSFIGIIVFDSEASIVFNITGLVTKEDKDAAINSLPNQMSQEKSCIGCGLSASLQLLHDMDALSGGSIVLISNGNQSMSPTIVDVYSQLIEADVQINWIAYGNYPGDELPELITETRGQMYHAPDGMEGISSMAAALYDSTRLDQIQKTVVVVDKIAMMSNDFVQMAGTFPIDKNIGKNTIISVIYDYGTAEPQVSLDGPFSGPYYLSSSNSSYGNALVLTIPFAEIGSWSYSIEPKVPNQNISFSVSSTILEDDVDMIIKGWTSIGFEMSNVTDKPVVLYASVKRGSYPIFGATVVAKVTSPCQNSVSIQLLDNGAAPDFQKLDGVYSRYFTQFCGHGHYGVQVQVNGKTSLGAQDDSQYENEFQRVVTSTSFYIVNDDYLKLNDTLPPTRIMDLKVTQNSSYSETHMAMLEWTAPGDDYDYGIADHYEMKYGDRIAMVRGNGFINNTQLITEDMILYGSIVPLTAGSQQWVMVALPPCLTSYFVAMAAVDEAGNMPMESNIVQIFSPKVCESDGQVYPNLANCSIYYVCESKGNKPTPMACPSGLCYSTIAHACDWPNN